jgi:GT2 family glycosyltransferase
MTTGKSDIPLLSIAIVNWNNATYLPACFESLAYTINKISTEVIFVDNASSDESVTLVQTGFPWVKVIHNDTNLGFVRGNNQIIDCARGKYILFLNPDTKIVGDAILKMIEYLELYPTAGVIGPLLLNEDGSPQHSYFGFPGFWSVCIEHLFSARLMYLFETMATGKKAQRRVSVIRGACLLSRLELVRRVGGMNHRMFMYSEETDLCYKIHRLGFDVEYYPQANVYHFQRGSVKFKPEKFIAYHYLRSRLIFISENYNSLKARLLLGIINVSLNTRVIINRFINPDRSLYYRELLAELRSEGLI